MVRANQNALVISGTANSGEAIAKTVADAGGTVIFTYNSDEERAEQILEDLPGEDHEAIHCDVTDPDSVESLVDTAVDNLGEIDALVYTVGVISRAPIEEMEGETWQTQVEANATGAFNVLKATVPVFKEQEHGAIVALAASEGIMSSAQLSAYDASKQGLIALVQEAARELGPHGVRANIVSPGFIRDPDDLSDEQRADLIDDQPYKQVTSPEDVANACLFFCSDEAATITGVVLPVDSGLAL